MRLAGARSARAHTADRDRNFDRGRGSLGRDPRWRERWMPVGARAVGLQTRDDADRQLALADDRADRGGHDARGNAGDLAVRRTQLAFLRGTPRYRAILQGMLTLTRSDDCHRTCRRRDKATLGTVSANPSWPPLTARMMPRFISARVIHSIRASSLHTDPHFTDRLTNGIEQGDCRDYRRFRARRMRRTIGAAERPGRWRSNVISFSYGAWNCKS